ncbi:hypothetical protein [Moorena sp. SIO3H5]|nr:hypothetical protein [Moorena sp. SIO3H5]
MEDGDSCLLPLASCLLPTPYSLLPTPYYGFCHPSTIAMPTFT